MYLYDTKKEFLAENEKFEKALEVADFFLGNIIAKMQSDKKSMTDHLLYKHAKELREDIILTAIKFYRLTDYLTKQEFGTAQSYASKRMQRNITKERMHKDKSLVKMYSEQEILKKLKENDK